MHRKTLGAALLIVAALAATQGPARAQAQASSEAECARQRDSYKKGIIEFKKGIDLSRKLIEQQARAAGKEYKSDAGRDEPWRDPEKLAAEKYQECLAGAAKRAKQPAAPASEQPSAATKTPRLRLATAAEITECQTEAGKLGAVFTLDTTTKEMSERKPTDADKTKYSGPIFAMCLEKKGAKAPTDAAAVQRQEPASGSHAKGETARTSPVLVREGPEKKCDGSTTCSSARAGCLHFCRTKPDSTACPKDCRTAHSRCLVSLR